MNLTEATEFLRPAVDPALRVWADLGAGSGTFTTALATILDERATIYAVDRDPDATRRLGQLQLPSSAPDIVPVTGDLERLGRIPELVDVRWDAAVVANVLHYFADPARVLAAIAMRLGPGGRVVLIEYDRKAANRWVPHPIPLARAADLAHAAGFEWHGVVAQRPSQYQGTMYCAVLIRGTAAR